MHHRARLRRKTHPVQRLYDLFPPTYGLLMLLALAGSSIGGSAYWAIKGNVLQMLLSAILPLWGAASTVISLLAASLGGSFSP